MAKISTRVRVEDEVLEPGAVVPGQWGPDPATAAVLDAQFAELMAASAGWDEWSTREGPEEAQDGAWLEAMDVAVAQECARQAARECGQDRQQGVGVGSAGEALGSALRSVVVGLEAAGEAAETGALVGVFEPELVAGVEAVGRARLVLDGVGFALAREAADRGLHTEVGLSLVDWLRVRCPWLSRPEACQVQDVVRAAGAHWGGPLAAAAVQGATGMGRLALVARTVRRFAPALDADQVVEYADIAVGAATDVRISDKDLGLVCRKLLEDLLDEAPKEQVKATARELRCVRRRGLGQGMARFTIDAPDTDAALIDGILNGPLAAPAPGEDGTRDSRMAGQRKYDALLMVLNRGLANPGAPPSSGRASVIVTIKADPATGAPCGVGVAQSGQLLDAGQVGRFACLGDVTPIVLGEDGEPVALGRTVRLATPGQFKALLVRDEHCTYPGCSVPATWCDSHHLVWWSRGGRTDLANLALLCPRHHTLVHDKDLQASVNGAVVTWHV